MPVRAHLSAIALLLSTASLGAAATQITQLSPQGEVARVRQISAQFDRAATAFGSPDRPDPLQLQCNDAAATAGHGRWTSARQWVYDFDNALPPGVQCQLQVVPGFRTQEGQPLEGTQRFAFSTGGPVVQSADPYKGAQIEEDQVFLLRFNGAVDPATVQRNTTCSLEGVGERIAVRLVTGAQREALIKASRWASQRVPAAELVALACQRRFTPSAKLSLVLGKGIATPGGVATTRDERLDFRVRDPFEVSFSCERESANAPCLPLRRMSVHFSAPVSARLALALRLRPDGGAEALPARLTSGDTSQGDDLVEDVEFAPTLTENARYHIELPKDLVDASGRAPDNAAQFPLAVATGPMPPLLKFAAAPFGVIERLAEPGGAALMPLTVRRVEPELQAMGLQVGARQVSDLRLSSDADIIAWYGRVRSFHRYEVPRTLAARWSRTPLPRPADKRESRWVETRALGLLQDHPQARRHPLPTASEGDQRPTQVLGLPLQPGFHVLEIGSPMLGRALLDPRYGERRTMYVRSSALVTNLGVHFKLGRENALAWVTTLDKGQPVREAAIQVSDCKGRLVAKATTDASGVARIEGLPSKVPNCYDSDDGENEVEEGGSWFVSARAKSADGVDDLAFTWSDWNRGIESWRFDLPTPGYDATDTRVHTVLDRALLRAGETVSMKHFIRQEVLAGLRVPSLKEGEVVVTHEGSGQEFRQDIVWRRTATGGLSATSEFRVPPGARLGLYTVRLSQSLGPRGTEVLESARFRVEEFRLPVLSGQLQLNGGQPLLAARSAPVDLQVSYLSGGGAARLPTRVSAQLRPHTLSFPGYEGFSFETPHKKSEGAAHDEESYEESDEETSGESSDGGDTATRLVADKLPLNLDAQGRGQTVIADLPLSPTPEQLVVEASYADPNGEIQTLRQVGTLWPAAVVAGIRTDGWVSTRGLARFQALALGIDGRPAAGVKLAVTARTRVITTARKRLVGGFYTYDDRTETHELGTVCSGQSDARGLLLCEARLEEAGEVELVVSATDSQGRSHQSMASVYVTHQGELWFGGEDHDRMDVLPEKKHYEPGETARLQVRMPFRYATALVSIEREGVLETRVVTLRGSDPTIEIKIEPGWGPNVFVSVMALRGRLREVPWYSLFTWGYQAPREWWTAFWYEGREYVAPTTLVDLSKPAYRLGVAELQVGTSAHEIRLSVSADRDRYPVRGQAKVTIEGRLPDGRPAAGAEVALAVVDQALLELAPNRSTDLLHGLWQRRAWAVETATAQMEIIGRRHYGRKALPAGGGGGRSPTRELFDTLLLWQPSVTLDAQGRATVTVPLNDAITRFQVVAVADAGTDQFGTGESSLLVTQDLQIISGLPPLVREGDRFVAQFSLRNSTAQAMKVQVSARATLLQTPAQTVEIPAGQTRELQWTVEVPQPLGLTRQQALLWEVQAQAQDGTARDALKISQRVLPAVPLTVQQATLVQLDGPLSMPVSMPTDAVADAQGQWRGGVRIRLQPTLGDGLPGVREWLADYPYACLEQKTSKALGLRDAQRWKQLLAEMPAYLDSDGLANYFPPQDGQAPSGSDTLSVYLLSASHEASALDPAWALTPAVRDEMLRGLESFVQGRIERRFWSPRQDLDMRKIAAVEALSRYGRASARLLQSVEIAPNRWPTNTVIDWLLILRRVQDLPQRSERLQEAQQILRARLSYQGTRVVLGNEADERWWWLMHNGDVSAARLLLAVIDDPDWKDDMGRLASGLLARQQRGAWQTTTANLWGSLALQKFSARFEAEPVKGRSRASLGGASGEVDWSQVVRPARPVVGAQGFANVGPTAVESGAAADPWPGPQLTLPWPRERAPANLTLTHEGSGKPWATLQSLAAVDQRTPVAAGYQIRKTLTALQQATPGRYSRGDIVRVSIDVTASATMRWVVLNDPIPAGATILGSGLGRDSEIATQGEKRSGVGWPVFEERSFEAYRSYYDDLPAGQLHTEYTMRLNNPGEFSLPPTRIEAMYAPEMFGLWPNPRLRVEAGP